MADLMNKTSSYDSLVQRYKNFMTPAFKIKCQGKDIISSLQAAVEDVSLNLSLDHASSCSFTIVNAYDLKARSFYSKFKSQLVLGTVINVEIGYGSTTTLVFKGYISEVSYEFRDVPVISITALDVRRLMMESKARMMVHSVQSYSQAFSEVMKRYQKICTALVIDKTDEKLPNVTQRLPDYDFVAHELCRKADREFFVLAGKAYFRTPQKVTAPVLTLEWGKGLMSFSRNALYYSGTVKVIGFDEENKKTLVAEEKVKGDPKQKTVISDPQPTVITDPDAFELNQAQKRAKAEGNKNKHKSQGGRGTCVGLPELVPGRFLQLKKLDKDIDGTYYLKNVSHSLGADGFTTSFSIGGWK